MGGDSVPIGDFNFADPGEDGSAWEVIESTYHITHINDARKILEDGKIFSRIVYDESKMNKSRCRVVWTSPHIWADGSIYGNVRFHFNFKKVSENKKLYFVEMVESNGQYIFRYLLTGETPLPEICAIKYNDIRGSVRFFGGKYHYYSKKIRINDQNNKSCVTEIMIQSDFSLDEIVGFDFVDHHNNFCRGTRPECKNEERFNRIDACKIIIPFIFGSGIKSVNRLILDEMQKSVTYHRFHVKDFFIKSDSCRFNFKDEEVKYLLMASLLAKGMGKEDLFKELISIISCEESRYLRILSNILSDHFDKKITLCNDNGIFSIKNKLF
ncbi:MAG: hypothetical protein H7833_11875 [Magnetococcus sp. DMHC-1]